jgi:hypothetical protein
LSFLEYVEPQRALGITLTCSKEQAVEKLALCVEPGMWLLWVRRDHRPFEGYVNNDTFCITRIRHYGNWFRARIEGTVTSANGGSFVLLRMKMFTITRVLYSVFLFLSLIIASACFIDRSSRGTLSVGASIVFVGIPAFIFVLAHLSFLVEVRSALSALGQVWSGHVLDVHAAGV